MSFGKIAIVWIIFFLIDSLAADLVLVKNHGSINSRQFLENKILALAVSAASMAVWVATLLILGVCFYEK